MRTHKVEQLIIATVGFFWCFLMWFSTAAFSPSIWRRIPFIGNGNCDRRQRLFALHDIQRFGRLPRQALSTRPSRRHARTSGANLGEVERPLKTIVDRHLLNSSHILTAAKEGAAFDPDGIVVDFDDMSRIGLAVVHIVKRSRPFPRAIRHHSKYLDADQRAATFAGIRVILVSPGRSCGRINLRLGACHGCAQPLAAGSNTYPCAILCQPKASWISQCRAGDCRKGEGTYAAEPEKSHGGPAGGSAELCVNLNAAGDLRFRFGTAGLMR